MRDEATGDEWMRDEEQRMKNQVQDVEGRGLIASPPRRLIASSPRHLIASSPRRLVASSPRRLIASLPLAPCLLLLAICTLALALRAPRISTLGTHLDEGVNLAAAQQVSQGKIMYRDVADDRPPGLPWIIAVVFHIFGPGVVAPRWLSVLTAPLTCLLVYLIGRQTSSTRVGLLGALFFALDPLNVFWSRFTLAEQFMALLTTLSICVFLSAHRGQSWPRFALVGILAGCAFVIKQPGVVILGAYSAFLLIESLRARQPIPTSSTRVKVLKGDNSPRLWPGGHRYRPVLRRGLLSAQSLLHKSTLSPPTLKGNLVAFTALVAGFGLLYLSVLGYFWLNHALPDYIRFSFEMGASVIRPLWNISGKLSDTLGYFIRRPSALLALTAIPLIMRTRGKQYEPLLLLWAGFDYFFLFLPDRLEYGFSGYSHYVLSTTASLSLLGAIGLDWCWRQLSPPVRGSTGRPLTPGQGLAALVLLTFVASSIPFTGDVLHTLQADYPQSTLAQESATGDNIRRHTSEGDRILVFSNSVFYLWANREPASRFIFYTWDYENSPFRNDFLAEIVRAALDDRTALIAVSKRYPKSSLPWTAIAWLEREFDQVASLEYDYQGGVRLFKKRAGATGPALVPTFTYGELGIQHPVSSNLSDQVLLLGYDLDKDTVHPGDHVRLALFWQALRRMDEDYTIFVHLRDQAEQNVAQRDHQLFGGMFPTSVWREGEKVREESILAIAPDTLPGQYTLKVGMYLRETMQRLPVADDASGENAVVLGTITVTE